MESLLSVVFYCALLWLPHNDRNGVETILEEFFEGAVVNSTGGARGGIGKTSALSDLSGISQIVWECEAMQEWISGMRQRFVHKGDNKETWSPLSVGTFWEEILGKPSLKTRDRMAELPPLDGNDLDGNLRYLGMVLCPTTIPNKRAFGDAASGPSTSVVTSTTVERNVRRRMKDANLSSMPKDHDATPPARTRQDRPQAGPSKGPGVALNDRRAPIKKTQKLDVVAPESGRRDRGHLRRALGAQPGKAEGRRKRKGKGKKKEKETEVVEDADQEMSDVLAEREFLFKKKVAWWLMFVFSLIEKPTQSQGRRCGFAARRGLEILDIGHSPRVVEISH